MKTIIYLRLRIIKFARYSQFGGYCARENVPFKRSPCGLANVTPEKYLKPVTGKAQIFTTSDLISQDKFKNLELIPFYKLHDARYMIYWHEGAVN